MNVIDGILVRGSDHLVAGASPVDAVSGEISRPLVGLLLGLADTGTGGVRRSTGMVCRSTGGICRGIGGTRRSTGGIRRSTSGICRSTGGIRWGAYGVRRSARGVRWSARGLGTRGGRRAVRVRWNARGRNRRGGRNERRVGRVTPGEADNPGTGRSESIIVAVPDVLGPFESVVHSREAGELAG